MIFKLLILILMLSRIGLQGRGTTLGQGMLGSTSFAVGTGSGYTLTPSFQFTYDQLGRTLAANIGAANANTTTINNYDDLGRVTQTTNPLGQFNLSYLTNTGRLSSVSMPNGVTTSLSYADYNGSSFTATIEPLLTEIKNAKATTNMFKFDHQYDADNRISQWTQTLDASPLTNWNYGYDSIGQLTSAVKTSSTNAVLSQYAYSYDPAGNRTSQEINNSSQNTVTKTAYATTNEAGAQSAGGTLLWKGSTNQPLYSVKLNSTMATIDSTGTNFIANVPVTSGANTVTVTAEDTHADINTDNHNVTVAGNTATAPIYDNNGNTTTDSVGNTYTYDAFNNLITETYKSSGATTTYSYYGSSRVKIAESTGSIKQFIMAGGMAAEEWDGATPIIAKRFYGQGVITYSGGVGTNYFYTRDHLGSIRELMSSTGTLVTRLDYDPYGVTSVVFPTSGPVIMPDFAYAGMYQHQPSGNYLSATRLYNPNLGKWLSRDPIAESGGVNMYAYCDNNPIDFVDSDGLLTIAFIGAGHANSGGNPDLVNYIGASNSFDLGLGASDPVEYARALAAVKAAEASGDNSLKIIGYSRGAEAANTFAGMLQKQAISVNQLTLIDPVSKGGSPQNLTVPCNVQHANDFYQQNKGTSVLRLPLGQNPYRGGPISNPSTSPPLYLNDNLTGVPSGFVNKAGNPVPLGHLNIVQYLISNNLILGSPK